MADKTCPLDGKTLPEDNTSGFCASHWYKHTGKFIVKEYIAALRKGVEIPEAMRPRLHAKQRETLTAEGLEVPPEPSGHAPKGWPVSTKSTRRAARKVKPKGPSKQKRKVAARSKGISAIAGKNKANRNVASAILDSLNIREFSDLPKALTAKAEEHEKEADRLHDEAVDAEEESKRLREGAVKLRAAAKLLSQTK